MGVLITLIISLALPILLVLVPMWKIYTKAAKPGWAVIIPIYNMVVLVEIIKKPMWWVIMMLIVPIANIVFSIMAINELSKAFGKSVGFTVGLILLPFIFIPILGYGSAQYTEPADPAVQC